MTFEHSGPAVIVQHCAVFGRMPKTVRWVKTGEPRPYAQFPTSVAIAFIEPRKRSRCWFTMKPDNLRYATIEIGGNVVWDSRDVVPVDMDFWQETRKRFEKTPAMTSSRIRVGG